MTEALKQDFTEFVEDLKQIVGAPNVLMSENDLRFYSSDVFKESILASLVVIPQTTEQLSKAIELSTKENFFVIPRGGGLSYTDSYLPKKHNSIIFDLQNLNKIIEINKDDMFVVVEAGCTWEKLYKELKNNNLRTPYFGALSGLYSTVGGAMSQNSIFFGSGHYGSAADQCLGLEVVLADGSILRTGSWSTNYNPSPFFRSYGPDLTGLFLSDTGSLGFKTKIVMKLVNYPKITDFLSFSFENYDEIANSMSEISREGLAAECFGFDPYLQGQRLKREGILKDFKSLANVAKSGNSVISGLKDAAKVAIAGRSMFKGVPYSMHVVVDSESKEFSSEKIGKIRRIANLNNAKEIEPSLPKIMRANPFAPPNSMLGPNGERWVPIHAIVPHSRAKDLMYLVHDYFAQKSDLLEKHKIEWGYLLATISNQGFLMEPVFFWEDSRYLFHERYLGDDYISKLNNFEENIPARKAVENLREDLSNLFMEFGAVHFQIGRSYKYKEGKEQASWDLLKSLKKILDPKGLVNPGSLGL
ncbi:MAG: FAD-binding protein [Rhodospirillaceae bacterium]|nr:FAD-binding protein [Rhodospirillaceae bacterium]|tara:strand:+ start:16754 stop:18343 length:1590 start_codon:yes stop_codon:yes gene_type:complete